MLVSQLDFHFNKKQSVTLWLLNRYFGGQKWRGNMYFKKNLFAVFKLKF